MKSDLNESINDTAEKYGISVSCRIPVRLQKDIGNEAALRGISFARHLTSIVQIGHQQEAQSNAEINILLREKDSLLKEVNALTKELELLKSKLNQQNKDEQYLAPLRRNRNLLQKHSSAGSVTLKTLEQEGFDFTFATQTMVSQDKQFFCIMDMCYYQVENLITIKSLNS